MPTQNVDPRPPPPPPHPRHLFGVECECAGDGGRELFISAHLLPLSHLNTFRMAGALTYMTFRRKMSGVDRS
jgi:hypothetical protein